MEETKNRESIQVRFTGCQVAALVGGILLVAGVCVVLGLVLGGAVGYLLGREAAGSAPAWGGPLPNVPSWPTPFVPAAERPYLGIRYRQLEEGAEVVRVDPDGPAEEAGLQVGDVILEVDGEQVGLVRGKPLEVLILNYQPGDRVRLGVEREGERIEIEVELGRWSDRQP